MRIVKIVEAEATAAAVTSTSWAYDWTSSLASNCSAIKCVEMKTQEKLMRFDLCENAYQTIAGRRLHMIHLLGGSKEQEVRQ